MGWRIGVDLGGTNVRAVLAACTGEVAASIGEPLDREADPGAPFAQLLEQVHRLIDDAAADRPIDGIGIGVTGPLDVVRGIVDNPHTLPAAMQGPIREVVAAGTGLPVFVDNDANAAALGEARFGAGRDGDVVVCVTVGTGIGVGTVVHGSLLEGADRTHPEPGHLVVDHTGPRCYCGARGCLESLASASAVRDAAARAGIIGPDGTARDVHSLASSGHPGAAAITERARRALASGIRTMAATYAPDVIVLAGGGLGDVDATIAVVQAELSSFPFGAPGAVVRPSALGELAGSIGATLLVEVER